MQNLFLTAQRISTDSKKMKIILIDKDFHNKDFHYEIVVKNLKTSIQKTIAFIKADDNKLEIKNNEMYFDITHETECYGTKYIYYATKRLRNNKVVDNAESEIVTSLPSKIQNLKIDYAKSLYTLTGIPNKVLLTWDKPNLDTDNYNLKGYIIYYSICKRTEDVWSRWEPLCENSTESTGLMNIINKNTDSIEIDVPQVCNFYDPHNIRFTIVGVCSDIDKFVKSRSSNIAEFILKDAVSNILKPAVGVKLKLTTQIGDIVTAVIEDNSNTENLSCILKTDPWIPVTNTYKNKIAFELLTNKDIKANITISIKTQLAIDEKYEIRIFKNNRWMPIPSTHNLDNSSIIFHVTEPCKFALLRNKSSFDVYDYENENRFNDITNSIIKKMPRYIKARTNPHNSMAGVFLNIIGLQIQDVKFLLDYAYNQVYLDTADTEALDIIYKTDFEISNIDNENTLYVTTPGYVLENALTLENFINDYKDPLKPEIYYNDSFLVDLEKKIIYVKKPYNKSEKYQNGFINIELYEPLNTEPVYSKKLPLRPHHVWNFFDEFGLLLNTPRLPEEKNKAYKERLLDVFKNPSNSSKEGLMNGIARELGIRINRVWEDTTQDFIIKDPMVITNMIKVNNEYVDPSLLYITDENYIIIKPDETFTKDSIVTYVSGLELHAFNRDKDKDFKNQLYTIEGTATKNFKHYVSLIKHKIPLDWGQFKWDIGHWDTCKESNGGNGFLPHICDASIEGFKNYNK